MLRETRPAAWSFAESICLRQLNLRAPRRSRSRDPFYSTSVDAACSAVATPCEGIFPVDIVIAHVAFATASNDAFPETWTLRACQYTAFASLRYSEVLHLARLLIPLMHTLVSHEDR